MKPEDTNKQPDDMPMLSHQPVSADPSSEEIQKHQQNQEAAANVIRSQIDNILDKQTQSASQLDAGNPYFRNHQEHVDPQTEKWREYHTAWQNYYQKYYEGYYQNSVKRLQEQYGRPQPKKEPTKDEEMFDLRQKLIGKVRNSANKVHKSRHFIPIIAGLIAVLLFLFLQYNQLIFANIAAYVSPGNIDPQNIILDPNSEITVSADPRLIIPKINVDVPVVYDIGSDYDSQMEAMTQGVAHFAIPGANSQPGEIGNTVIAGHSSNDLFDSGKYKFIFAQLDKLEVGDIIYANYKSTRYTYTVTKKEVVAPTNVDVLIYETKTPVLTLITCTPLGTAKNRLLVTAEQISPDPSKAVTTTTKTEAKSTTSIPGTAQTLIEKLFGSK